METSKNSDIIIFLITGMAVLFILAFAMVAFFRLYKKRIIKQQAKIFEQEKKHQQDLLYSNIQSVETERKRIAKDIHDELGSIFSTLSLQLRKYTQTDSNQLSGSQELIESGLKTVRRIAHEMMPPELELFGLEKALENLATRINTGNGPQVAIEYNTGNRQLTEVQSLALYRVAQELVTNTLKHANASEICINIYPYESGIYFKYTDNGKGITAPSKSAGMGMKNIQSRAGMIGAVVLAEAAPVKGYACTIQLALTLPVI
jgi:two-component system, NarL family, sensor kinase